MFLKDINYINNVHYFCVRKVLRLFKKKYNILSKDYLGSLCHNPRGENNLWLPGIYKICMPKEQLFKFGSNKSQKQINAMSPDVRKKQHCRLSFPPKKTPWCQVHLLSFLRLDKKFSFESYLKKRWSIMTVRQLNLELMRFICKRYKKYLHVKSLY